jgi:phosphatidylserine decarboxylase
MGCAQTKTVVHKTTPLLAVPAATTSTATIPVAATTTTPKFLGVLFLRVIECKLAKEDDGVVEKETQSPRSIAPFVVVSVADRTYETRIVEKDHPLWNQKHFILLHTQDMYKPITISLMSMNTFTRYSVLGEVKPAVHELVKDFEKHDVWLPVKAALDGKTKGRGKGILGVLKKDKNDVVIAQLHIWFQLKPLEEVANQFWIGLGKQFDFDHNGQIDPFELRCMLEAIGSTLKDDDINKLVESHRGPIPIPTLPSIMNRSKEQHLVRMRYCPVCRQQICGRPRRAGLLTVGRPMQGVNEEGDVCCEDAYVISHVGPCLASNNVEDLLIGNFLLDVVGIHWWKEPLTEWKSHNQLILESGNILVYSREKKTEVEEVIPVISKLAMRALYPRDSPKAEQFLKKLTCVVGTKYNAPSTRRYIQGFIHFYKIPVDDIADSIPSFQNFNEFLARRLKIHSRPIADINNQRIAVIPADSRVIAFETINDAKERWVKGPNFNLDHLLQDRELAMQFHGGSIVMCRMAPEDSHRFIMPVGCSVGKIWTIDGTFYVDNPIVIREAVDVYTSNHRVVAVLEDTIFGRVLYVCVGSTMVGSIHINKQQSDCSKKGDEFGYFGFGGCTIVLLFQPDKIIFAHDLLANSKKPIETYCKMGTALGVFRR